MNRHPLLLYDILNKTERENDKKTVKRERIQDAFPRRVP